MHAGFFHHSVGTLTTLMFNYFFFLPLIILYLTVGLWKLKSHCLSQHVSYQRSLSWYYSHSTREFKLSADIISQSACYTSRSLKVMTRCVSYIPYSAVSCSALFYGGCLGLQPSTATVVKSILATGDWPQLSGAENRNVASFHWAVT